jgi:hypothetical protein
MKRARVKDLLISYSNDGMTGVARYLSDENIIIEKDSWVEKMKSLLDSRNWSSMEAEIALIFYKFNLKDKNGKSDTGEN